MEMSTQEYWAEIDAERAAKRDKDIEAAREAIGLDALKVDAMLYVPRNSGKTDTAGLVVSPHVDIE